MPSFVVNHGIITSHWKHLIHIEVSHTFGKQKSISKYCFQNIKYNIYSIQSILHFCALQRKVMLNVKQIHAYRWTWLFNTLVGRAFEISLSSEEAPEISILHIKYISGNQQDRSIDLSFWDGQILPTLIRFIMTKPPFLQENSWEICHSLIKIVFLNSECLRHDVTTCSLFS